MIRLLQSKGTAVFRFAEKSPKGVGQHLKMKNAETLSSKIAEGNVPTPEGLAISHRLLYVQYVPAVIMAVPSLYYLGDPSSILFNNALNLMQYYLSGLLCFNSFFAKSTSFSPSKHHQALCTTVWSGSSQLRDWPLEHERAHFANPTRPSHSPRTLLLEIC